MNDFSALILPTTWTNGMGKPHLATITALNKIGCRQTVMRTATIPAAFGNFTFWKWAHFNFSYRNNSSNFFLIRRHIIPSAIKYVKIFIFNLIPSAFIVLSVINVNKEDKTGGLPTHIPSNGV
ncbi:MAG: hypothetical protein BGO78_01930 [Chloroflexi bacterium 44-23]|nr:MAG: hypothetical protein BGO78_01930 [Chloroflexi bacterium 44-23]